MPHRCGDLYENGYRYGFNDKEKDNEIKGTGNSIDYGARMYDPRVGRFFKLDPLTKKFTSLTPYQFSSNDPIESVDLDGEERYDFRWVKDNKGKPSLKLIGKTNIEDRIVIGYKSGRSLGNDAPLPTYEIKVNQRQEFIVHTDYEEYIDNNGGLNMDKPVHKEIFDVRTFYHSYSEALAGKNGKKSLTDRLAIARAMNAASMGPENAALPALGLGNIRKASVAAIDEVLVMETRATNAAANLSDDCSDIANTLSRMDNAQGNIIEITTKDGSGRPVWGGKRSFKGMEYGKTTEFDYHQVYQKNGFIYDPMFSSEPVKSADYFKSVEKLNPGMKLDYEKVE